VLTAPANVSRTNAWRMEQRAGVWRRFFSDNVGVGRPCSARCLTSEIYFNWLLDQSLIEGRIAVQNLRF
jgi:hypothetical protein